MKSNFLLLFLILFYFAFAEWTILETFSIPEGASGLAWDGTYLYCGIYGVGGDQIFQIDSTDGSAQLLFTDPNLDDTYGLTSDGNHLWLTDHRNGISEPAVAYEYDISGNVLSELDLPAHYMSGIAYDDGDFWVSAYYDPDGEIYKIDDQGNILQQFAAPDNQPWDLCLENNYLWMADYWGDTLYKIDPVTGSLLESFPSEGIDPAGIVYDGQFLWYCDNGAGGSDYLYKVDLGGEGTPAISLEWDEYDFGNTVIGTPENIDLLITNSGIADLEVTALDFTAPEFSAVFQPPLVIAPDATVYLSITFSPFGWGEVNSQLFITSNDPVNPEVEVSFSGYGIYPDQEIVVDQNDLNWYNIRAGSVSGNFLNISNQGNEQLIIDDLQFVSELFFIDDTVELPITLNTREEYNLRVWFSPEEEGDFADVLAIQNNDPDEDPLTVGLQGNSVEQDYPVSTSLWEYSIDTSWDNSPKAIGPISDISGDYVDDVIICSEDGFIRCFNGNSSTMADVLWEFPLPTGYVYSQRGLSGGFDIDYDGYNDLVVGTAGGDKSIRMLSGKTGEQIWIYQTDVFGEGGWVYQVSWEYDHNQDEIPDVLACAGDDSYDTGPKRVFCIDGSTGESLWTYFAGGPVFSVIGLEDVNYDGIMDVLAGASNESETEGKVLALDGDSGSLIWDFVTIGSSVWGLSQVDDFTSDGIKDLVAGDFYGNYYGLDAVNGNSEWSGTIGNYVLITRFEKLDDVDNDGHPDILIENSSNNAVVVNGHEGGNVWSQNIGDNSLSVDRIPDINGDMVNDVLIGSLNNSCYFLNGTTGSTLGSFYLGEAVDAIAAIPDITGDNSYEMVAGGRNGQVVCLSGGIDVMVDAFDDEITPSAGIILSLRNHPNPFNPSTVISFQLSENNFQQDIKLSIYNLKGQKIRQYSIFNEQSSIVWDGTDQNNRPVPSGIYLYKISAGKSSSSNKMILLK